MLEAERTCGRALPVFSLAAKLYELHEVAVNIRKVKVECLLYLCWDNTTVDSCWDDFALLLKWVSTQAATFSFVAWTLYFASDLILLQNLIFCCNVIRIRLNSFGVVLIMSMAVNFVLFGNCSSLFGNWAFQFWAHIHSKVYTCTLLARPTGCLY